MEGTLIVDDNEDPSEYLRIQQQVKKFRQVSRIHPLPPIHIIRNQRTKGNSGTGAWNTAFDYLSDLCKNRLFYMALLDDDDEWDDAYIEHVSRHIGDRVKAVFPNMVRIHETFRHEYQLRLKDLTICNFLRGNPGVQGSNIVVRSDLYAKIGGFDENLRSTTDRDFMIRVLECTSLDEIEVIEEILAFHYALDPCSVTNNAEIKTAGLDQFYKKHLTKYSLEDLHYSLQRAKKFFKYPNAGDILTRYEQEIACLSN